MAMPINVSPTMARVIHGLGDIGTHFSLGLRSGEVIIQFVMRSMG
jgi:hypothetical protein